jgi:uncharacterized repeat protein (TIGR03803 family)
MKKLNLMKASCILFTICIALAISLSAQTLTTLANFAGGNGFGPAAGLVQGADGNFYGITTEPGIGSEGNVYSVTPSGTLTNLFNFCSNSCQDGQSPYAPLVLATNGYFYGTTQQGGTALEGNVYKITAGGTESNVYSFCTTNCDDGSSPSGPLIQVGSGGLYGTTTSTILKITLAGALITLYNFCPTNCTQNGPPYPSGLVLGDDGNFYGVTSKGGTNNDGTVFKMTPAGTLTTLHSFDGSDGANPAGTLVQGRGGYIYGVTFAGGRGTATECAEVGSCGTIFKITTSGSFTTLHNFRGTDGANPYFGLILATDGNLYGTTGFAGGNSTNAGTIFQISPGGRLTALYNFCSQTFCLDGVGPRAPLLQATNGSFYGTTNQGGTQTDGTVFSLSMGLGPFVETIPTSGKVAAQVTILGNALTGTTSVTFNGTTAAFTVVSDTEITATVPTGATTGTVKMTTPGGPLSSNIAFRVTH